MRKMIDRTEERFGLKPDWMAADTAYGSTDNLVWLTLGRKILPFIPVFDKGERTDGTLSRSDFTWDEENDRYICPEGKEMLHTRRTYSDPARNAPSWRSRKYRALKADCTNCPSKAKCCPNSETRAIHREKYESVRDFARQCTASEFNPTAQKAPQEGRDAVRTSQTHPRVGAAPITRPVRRPGRVHPRSHRPKPPEAREAQAADARHRVIRQAASCYPSQINAVARTLAREPAPFSTKSAQSRPPPRIASAAAVRNSPACRLEAPQLAGIRTGKAMDAHRPICRRSQPWLHSRPAS